MTSPSDLDLTRRPRMPGAWGVLAAWLAAAAALWACVAPADPAANESATYLPADAPSQRALAELQQRFPAVAGQSEAVIVFERPDANLAADDFAAIERLADRIAGLPATPPADVDVRGLHVRSPRSIPLPQNPLVSTPQGAGGQAALLIVETPANFVTIRSSLIVKHIRAILAAEALPPGLRAAVTGSSGYGADYAGAVELSNRRTSLVTIVAVLAILLAVYRAPLAAMVPLAAVSLAAAVVLKLLDVLSHHGLHAGTAERIFVFVLLYGAGTDYSLLVISRYRECLAQGLSPRAGVWAALRATWPAVLASGVTNSLGLLTLCSARFRIFQTTGPAVAMTLGLMTVAALTLVPALLALLGRAVFWPRRLAPGCEGGPPSGLPLGRGRDAQGTRGPVALATSPLRSSRRGSPFWRGAAVLVTTRPIRVLLVCAAALAAPALAGARSEWVYDQLTTLSPRYDAVRGMEMVKRRWGVGQLAPVTVLLRAQEPREPSHWAEVCQRATRDLLRLPGVEDVRSLAQPLGKPRQSRASSVPIASLLHSLSEQIVRQAALKEYLSQDRLATRLVVILRAPSLSREAMEAVSAVREKAGELAEDSLPGGQVLVTGATAEMNDVRAITSADFRRISALTVAVIVLILLVLVRRVLLSIFLAACTVLSYLAVLGITEWVFVGLLGSAGLDWKVQVFLFVVMVAVGVDYSIFLAARMVEESRPGGRAPRRGAGVPPSAIRRAVVHTGPVISSAGVIMAATLGSLMTGDLALLHQLGFALSLGMLLDTFAIRPLLVPSFAAALARLARGRQRRSPSASRPSR